MKYQLIFTHPPDTYDRFEFESDFDDIWRLAEYFCLVIKSTGKGWLRISYKTGTWFLPLVEFTVDGPSKSRDTLEKENEFY